MIKGWTQLHRISMNAKHVAISKQAKQATPLWHRGQWQIYRNRKAWQIKYITLPQTCWYRHHILAVVEVTTGWLETYPVTSTTTQNTLSFEKKVLWWHNTLERTKSDNGTHFWNHFIDIQAKKHSIDWVYHIPYHAPTARKTERCNRLLKAMLKAMGTGTFKQCDAHLLETTCLVNTRGSANTPSPVQTKPLRTVERDAAPMAHMENCLRKCGLLLPREKAKPFIGFILLKDWFCRRMEKSDAYLQET